MRNLILIAILIVILMGNFAGIATAKSIKNRHNTNASDTVEVKVIIEDYSEVKFNQGEREQPDMEIKLQNKAGARGVAKKNVWVAANFIHNIQTIVFDNPDDRIRLEKIPGTTADRTDISPGGHNYHVLVKAINEGQRETGVFTAGTVTVTVTKAF